MKAFKTLIILIFSCAISSISMAQMTSPRLQSIEVDISHDNEIIAIHTIKKNETLYGIARYYKVPLQRLMSINNILPDQIISLNSEIKVPINNEFINKSGVKKDDNWIPVIYTIKKKETLYTIGKKYFSQEIEDLNERNDINSFIIHENEKLIIGWWAATKSTYNEELITTHTPVSSEKTAIYTKDITALDSNRILKIQQKARQIAESNITDNVVSRPHIEPVQKLEKTLTLSKVYNQNYGEYVIIDSTMIDRSLSDTMMIEDPRTRINKKGICIWMKDDPETTQLLAFHRSAKIGSKMNVRYPLTNRTVEVEIVDNIKSNLYPDDVEIIVTKAVALKLGARDSRIQINMDYYQ